MLERQQDRALVGVHFLERNPALALGQVGDRRVQAVGDLVRLQRQQRVGLFVQPAHQDARLDLRVPRDRRHQRRAVPAGRVARGDVQQRRHVRHVHQRGHLALVAQGEGVVPELGLRRLELAGQADQRAHVAQRLVGVAFAHVVGGGQVLELEAGRAVLAQRPCQAFGAQGLGQAQHVQQVPARIAVAPFALVGVVEVAVKAEAHELVVEADRVVAHRAGLRLHELLGQPRHKRRLGQPVGLGLLRRDAGDHRRPGRGQQVAGRLAEQADRLADRIEIQVGADRRELGDARAPRVAPEGLEVVPEEARGHQSGASLSRTSASTASISTSSSDARPRVASTRIWRCTLPRSNAVA